MSKYALKIYKIWTCEIGVINVKDYYDINSLREYVNLQFGYNSKMFLDSVINVEVKSVSDSERYLVSSKSLRRYIDGYINRQYNKKYGREPITDEERNSIIRKIGATKGQKYHINDIKKMLKDERIQKLVQAQKEDKIYEDITLKGELYTIPKFVKEYYEHINPLALDSDEKINFYNLIKDCSNHELKQMKYVINAELKNREKLNQQLMMGSLIQEVSEVVESEKPMSEEELSRQLEIMEQFPNY